MKITTKTLILCGLVYGVLLTGCQLADSPRGPRVPATNPLIYADVPDPSIIRQGDTYYMSSTTMHMNPGVPIMSSTDLKHWELISYAHQALDKNNRALNLEKGEAAYSRGSWASSLQVKNGIYYVTTFSYTTGKTYIFTTRDIHSEDWQRHEIEGVYHDASLLLDDDGRNYLAYGHDAIHLVELNAAATGLLPGGKDQVIIPSASAVAGDDFILTAEGTQIQKINGWYYVHNICWPRGGVRTQVIHRARELTGPYEGRVVLQDKGIAQGEFIDTPAGKWYALLFGDRGAVGRIPYLVPITWEDHWPVLGVEGKVPTELDFAVERQGLEGIVASDEFNYALKDTALKLAWQWNHNPVVQGWSLSARPGFLRLTALRVDENLHQTRNTLTQRMFGPVSEAEIALEVGGMRDGDTAGLAAFADRYGFVGVRQEAGKRYLVTVDNSAKDHRETARVPFTGERVYLRVTGDFTFIDGDIHHRTDRAYFAYSLDGREWHRLGQPLAMVYELTHFMGYRFALFHYANSQPGGVADFDYFHVTENANGDET
ncbi:glycoside hydrolase 43 family protein [Teredinibacter turnerae]|uniref:glycoside hydrolase family 43 protein n=1 Tax=Teredinibacter turnerae TaxID=2426 RepID=UPI00037D3655|nr:glycoside hydrolase 43 family protein [Teredinibacter turnerae]